MNRLWYQMKEDELFNQLKTDNNGLSSKSVKKRIEKYGYNELPSENKNTLLKVFIKQFLDPIVIILLIAAVFSFIIDEKVDAFFILIVILSDGLLGTFQEWRAEKSAESLSNMMTNKVTAIRNGEEVLVDSKELVIGDIVKLTSGDKVGADLRILKSSNLTVDEAFLTGESINIHKVDYELNGKVILPERLNMCFAGSKIMNGRATCVVVATSLDTEIGKIAKTVVIAKETKTPLVIRMERFTRQISIIIAILAFFLTFILYFKGFVAKEIFFFVVALSISAIPEGLPMVLTVVLSIATNKMSKKNVIVRRLNAVESLGSCTVIASDKTGTITLNEQTVKKVLLPDGHGFDVSGQGYNGTGDVKPTDFEGGYKGTKDQLYAINRLIYMNNEAGLKLNKKVWEYHGDAMDIALLSLSYKIKPLDSKVKENIVNLIPYESERKYSGVIYTEDKIEKVSLKGSVEVVLEKCNLMNSEKGTVKIDKEKIIKMNDELASLGYRVLGIADGVNKKKLTFMGLIGFIDPVRPDAKDAIKKCHNAGIKVLMITGDHPLTAAAIGREINLLHDDEGIATGTDVSEMIGKGHEEFDKYIITKSVFARVTPQQKLEIIEAFKRNGEFIAVTGDGVNDAPALKSANIGIAMGSGTEVAKETSDMIIVDNNFASIVNGVEEGRYAYSNIRKVVYLLISCGLAEVLMFVFAIMFNMEMPLVAVQLLWLNLVTDGIQDVALAFEKGEPRLMNEPPRNPKESIFNKSLITETVIAGLSMAIFVFIFYYIMINSWNFSIESARSYVLLIMVFMQNVHVFNARSEKTSAFKVPLKNNVFIAIGVIGVLLLQWFVSETSLMSEILGIQPIEFKNILIALLFTIPLLLIMETYKYFIRKKEA